MSQKIDPQVLYLGRWVLREHFRAYVYNSTERKLLNSYDEFSNYINTGAWFAQPTCNKEPELAESNVVDIKPKRGRKCQSPHKA